MLLFPALRPHEAFYWQLGRGNDAQWVVRDGDWKLLGNPRDRSDKAPLTDDDKLFLANLARDPSEMKNLRQDHPEVVERLRKLRDRYAAGIDGTN